VSQFSAEIKENLFSFMDSGWITLLISSRLQSQKGKRKVADKVGASANWEE
jgi:hypothetical protein